MVSITSRARTAVGEVVDLFATPLKASHYMELVNPLWTSHKLQARVESVWDETSDARTITLRPGRNWRRHRAGQHVRLGVPIGGRRFTRTYSISSSPERRDGCITITVKVLDGGRMSGHLVRNLQVGSYLPIGLPQGDFLVPESTPVRPLFITAGSGITPAMSMLRTWDIVGNVPDVAHVHYAPPAMGSRTTRLPCVASSAPPPARSGATPSPAARTPSAKPPPCAPLPEAPDQASSTGAGQRRRGGIGYER